MLADLIDYRPQEVEFVLTDSQKEEFKDVMVIFEGAKSFKECSKVLDKKFNCLFPEGEIATRLYDKHEIDMIREEYCVRQENDVPERKKNLQETLERIKQMKKDAEEAYNSVLLEIADLAARVKDGTTDFKLPSTETVRMAVNGHYLFYSWIDGKLKLVKAQKIPAWDRNGLWSQEDWNRNAFKEIFGIEFPEVVKPEQEQDPEPEEQPDDDMPFAEEGSAEEE
ncbi:MAG: hypothetical protein Q4P84_02635 [Elusimicrobiales bacterium]|nr:hypothetical protein [Elusimicrobiales bacterium]